MTDKRLRDAEKMPLATVGELRMWNFRWRGLDLDRERPDAVVQLDWPDAYETAVRFLTKMKISRDDIARILNHPEGELADGVMQEFSAVTRRRLFDVHRIRLALLLLYPENPRDRFLILSGVNEAFGVSPLSRMMAGRTSEVRSWLETRLST